MTSHRTLDPEIVDNTSVSVRRRRWTAAEKARIVEEAEAPGMSVSAVARLYGIAPSVLFRWRKLMEDGGLSAISANEPVVGTSELKQLKTRIRELERLLGRKTLEVEILKEAVAIAHSKKRISRLPLLPKDASQ